jgi:hypothetical protein
LCIKQNIITKPLFLNHKCSIALQTTEDHRTTAVGMYKGLQSAKLRLQNMGFSKRTVVGTMNAADAFKLVRYEKIFQKSYYLT